MVLGMRKGMTSRIWAGPRPCCVASAKMPPMRIKPVRATQHMKKTRSSSQKIMRCNKLNKVGLAVWGGVAIDTDRHPPLVGFNLFSRPRRIRRGSLGCVPSPRQEKGDGTHLAQRFGRAIRRRAADAIAHLQERIDD